MNHNNPALFNLSEEEAALMRINYVSQCFDDAIARWDKFYNDFKFRQLSLYDQNKYKIKELKRYKKVLEQILINTNTTYINYPQSRFWINGYIDEYTNEIRVVNTKIIKLQRINFKIKEAKEKGGDIPELERFNVELIKTIPIDNFVMIERNGFFKARADEKTASAFWYKNNNTWHDFGSQEGGDVIDLYMKIFNCDFVEACKNLTKYL